MDPSFTWQTQLHFHYHHPYFIYSNVDTGTKLLHKVPLFPDSKAATLAYKFTTLIFHPTIEVFFTESSAIHVKDLFPSIFIQHFRCFTIGRYSIHLVQHISKMENPGPCLIGVWKLRKEMPVCH